MSSQSLEIAKTRYQKGKIAFESGHYREAVEQLEKASALLAPNSRLAGEVKIWLVTAYEAGGRTEDAIALCEQLKRHPHWETSKQAKRLVYILKAPKLKRPQEWMTEIPDLGTVSDNESKAYFTVKANKSVGKKKPPEPELIDLTQVDTKDNSFIWVALIAIGVILGSLVWFSI
ncbi:MAG: outer membrane protein assembly factor BamD [Nostocaceae cyanobacterium]|nr:outer membrane protein assembly factor BamD [Nostocaceae cyanobacterium]